MSLDSEALAQLIIRLEGDLKHLEELISENTALNTTKHKNRMQELEYERETHRIMHEQILERGRIQRAEERKLLLEKRSLGR